MEAPAIGLRDTTTRPLTRGWAVLRALTRAEIRQTREFTLTGVLKWILEPLSYMLVYFVLVGVILKRPQFAFPVFLFCGLVPFRYFTGVVGGAMSLVTVFAPAITNRAFPREVLPLVLMGAEVTTLLVALSLFVPLMLVYHLPFSLQLLWIPVVLIELMFVTIGPAYLATLFGLYFPDFRGAAQNLIRVTYFVSTGLVAASTVPGDHLPGIIRANPLSGVFDSLRAVIIRGEAPVAFDVWYPFAFGVVVGLIGLGLYRRRQHEFAKEV